jgi:acetyltransferase-like isoleucine patch superfamily enzyme
LNPDNGHMKKFILSWLRGFLGAPPLPSSTWDVYKDYIEIHPSAIIGAGSSVKIFTLPKVPRKCIYIGEGAQIFGNLSILRPDATITIGQNTQIGSSNIICTNEITVGNDVLMAWGVTVIDSDTHSSTWSKRSNDVSNFGRGYLETGGENSLKYHDWESVKRLPVFIKDKAWVGFGVCILKGSIIGEGAIIGAGSVVSGKIEDWTIASGNPCRERRKIES